MGFGVSDEAYRPPTNTADRVACPSSIRPLVGNGAVRRPAAQRRGEPGDSFSPFMALTEKIDDAHPGTGNAGAGWACPAESPGVPRRGPFRHPRQDRTAFARFAARGSSGRKFQRFVT